MVKKQTECRIDLQRQLGLLRFCSVCLNGLLSSSKRPCHSSYLACFYFHFWRGFACLSLFLYCLLFRPSVLSLIEQSVLCANLTVEKTHVKRCRGRTWLASGSWVVSVPISIVIGKNVSVALGSRSESALACVLL
jgi:hypothetical protein